MAYNIGDLVKFDVSWDYQGPRYYFAKLKCIVGESKVLGIFDDKCWTEVNLLMPETMSWTNFSQRVNVTLKNVDLGKTYDVLVRLAPNIFGEQDWEWESKGIIAMGEPAPEYPDSEFKNLTVRVS